MWQTKLDMVTGRNIMVKKIDSPKFDSNCTFIPEFTNCRNLFPNHFKERGYPSTVAANKCESKQNLKVG